MSLRVKSTRKDDDIDDPEINDDKVRELHLYIAEVKAEAAANLKEEEDLKKEGDLKAAAAVKVEAGKEIRKKLSKTYVRRLLKIGESRFDKWIEKNFGVSTWLKYTETLGMIANVVVKAKAPKAPQQKLTPKEMQEAEANAKEIMKSDEGSSVKTLLLLIKEYKKAGERRGPIQDEIEVRCGSIVPLKNQFKIAVGVDLMLYMKGCFSEADPIDKIIAKHMEKLKLFDPENYGILSDPENHFIDKVAKKLKVPRARINAHIQENYGSENINNYRQFVQKVMADTFIAHIEKGGASAAKLMDSCGLVSERLLITAVTKYAPDSLPELTKLIEEGEDNLRKISKMTKSSQAGKNFNL